MEHTVAPVRRRRTGLLLGSVWLLVAIPLASAAILLLLGRRADRWGHWLGVRQRRRRLRARPDLLLPAARAATNRSRRAEPLGLHRASATCSVDFGLLFDPLSAVFVLLITGVGFLIHLYAVGYMAARRRAGGGSSATSTCSSPRCCCWCSATTT